MTLSSFDPICFGQYDVNEHPLMLHFQYTGSEDVFRYILVERIPISAIDPATRRKLGESGSEREIRDGYL